MTHLEHARDSFFDLRPKDKVLVDQMPYIVDSEARGGMGCILLLWKDSERVQHSLSAFGLKLALKAVLPEVADEDGIALFRRELTVWSAFQHANIVRLLAIVDGGDAGWIAAMDWCPGSLRDILDERGALSVEDATNVIGNLSDGLSHAYTQDQVLHLDLKPENVLYHLDFARLMSESKVAEDSLSQYRFMVSDWGIASIKQPQLNAIAGLPPTAAAAQRTFNNMGTLLYMAPERFKEGYSSSIPSDMFSLGMMYLEMLVGHLPFRQHVHPVQSLITGQYLQDSTLLLKRKKVPKPIVSVILSLIAFTPAERPQSYPIFRKQLVRASSKTNGIFSKIFN
ncbi:MAG: serine/threonine-protein kinase [Verrucomicrobiota bacterium]